MKQILIADDDQDLRFFLGEFLESRGFSCVCVENGSKALAAIQESRFDLVITDLDMPLMDGLELISNLQKTGGELSSIPVILLTGDLNPASGASGLQVGAVGILHKPFDRNELLAMVSDALYQKTLTPCSTLL